MKKITVKTEKYIELMGILGHLSTYDQRLRAYYNPKIPDCRNILCEHILEHFGKFKTLEAVNIFETLTSKESFIFDAPVKLFFRMGKLHKEEIINEELLSRAGNKILLEDMIRNADVFYEESNFEGFLEKNKVTYRNMLEDVDAIINKDDYIAVFEQYTGLGCSAYNVVLTPYIIGNYGLFNYEEGEIIPYPVITPIRSKELYFGPVQCLIEIIWHEISHSFINPWTDKYITQDHLNKMTADDRMQKQAYSDNRTIINENIIRALTVRLTRVGFGNDAAMESLGVHKKCGFKYIDRIIELLEVYEKNRAMYNSLEEYYDCLINEVWA